VVSMDIDPSAMLHASRVVRYVRGHSLRVAIMRQSVEVSFVHSLKS
jgi:hypothetical protein